MIWFAIYFGVGYGCELQGWGFWRALFWPVSLGKKIAEWVDA